MLAVMNDIAFGMRRRLPRRRGLSPKSAVERSCSILTFRRSIFWRASVVRVLHSLRAKVGVCPSARPYPKFSEPILDPYSVNWSKREASLDPTTLWTESGEIKEEPKAKKATTAREGVKKATKAKSNVKKVLKKVYKKVLAKQPNNNTNKETEMEE
ncbi:hypothetical protein B0T14DRAFT_566880 [Immersiella caudata]|uniref:Uncharacterized protein n=1 Tax=Immersiella caudata TaxID=314043 RepID=A0AA39WR72_9PEZI|nr:hypothetical protein B0T14DRAFT_566880 [Immersiella caudata]